MNQQEIEDLKNKLIADMVITQLKSDCVFVDGLIKKYRKWYSDLPWYKKVLHKLRLLRYN